MAGDGQQMHPNFGLWYSAVNLGHDAALIQARWTGLTGLLGQIDRLMIESLLRLAFRSRARPPANELERITRALGTEGHPISPETNERELEVLAAIALAFAMERTGDVAARTALATATTCFKGGRAPDLPMDLTALADTSIQKLAEAMRVRPSIDLATLSESPKLDFEKAVQKVRETPNWDGIMAALPVAAELTRASIRVVTQRYGVAVSALVRHVQQRDEELQMLWWLTARLSALTQTSFEEVPEQSRPLIFASEIASLTEFLPGVKSIRGLLMRAGLTNDSKTTVPALINGCDSALLSKWIGESDPSITTTPLHAAIKRQLETGPGDAWAANWAAVTGISSSFEISPLSLAEIFYRERLLMTT